MLPMPFAIRRQDEDVERREVIADVVDEARKRDVRQPGRCRLQHRLVVAAADEHEVHVGMRAFELTRRGDDELLALLVVVERPDVPDEQLARECARGSPRFVAASTRSPLLPLCTTLDGDRRI